MSKFTLDYNELSRIASRIGELADEFETERKQIHNDATSMGDAYKSLDNSKFVTQIEELCQELAVFKEKLLTVEETLKKDAKDYQDREDENANIANGLETAA